MVDELVAFSLTEGGENGTPGLDTGRLFSCLIQKIPDEKKRDFKSFHDITGMLYSELYLRLKNIYKFLILLRDTHPHRDAKNTESSVLTGLFCYLQHVDFKTFFAVSLYFIPFLYV